MMDLFAFTEFAKMNLCTSQRGWFNIMMACLEVFLIRVWQGYSLQSLIPGKRFILNQRSIIMFFLNPVCN